MKTNLDWDRYFQIADSDASFEDKLTGYVALAEAHFDIPAFEAFCAEHLGGLDAAVDEFFASDEARDAIRQKVQALYPPEEVEEFTALFGDRVQSSLDAERDSRS